MFASYDTVVSRIQRLANEQQRIYRSPARSGLSPKQCQRLAEIKIELKQLWLARKQARIHFRDALEDFGEERKFTRVNS